MNLQDLFTITSLTAAINKLPAVPGKVAALGIFDEKGVTTTSVTIDEYEGRLILVPNISRDADPSQSKPGTRRRRTFETLHLPLSRPLLPGQIQGVAGFGSEAPIQNQAAIINDHLQELKNSIEATREYQRVGALRGKLLDADGKLIEDLYAAFGVTQKKSNIALSVAGTDVRAGCMEAKRHAEKKLNGVAVTGFAAFVGPDFFDAFTGHANVQKAFANWQEAQDRIGGDVRNGFTFGGITFMEYDVTISGQRFIPTDIAQVFPIAKGVFRTFNAPANYNETVNTLGQPFYAKAEERRMGKGWDVEAQANPLCMCMYPEALVELKAT
ncbi:major capsid protein [Alcaligenaceae bacterium]|nr:major capsid protein [Alcaligenaceae bacterium]